uniref:Uncharacterized protein n=1 Tax=Oryza meridionalis TaxID=40149 RepID=A0A0E0DTK5_9ORYZ
MKRSWLPVRTSGEGRGRGLARREEDAATGDEPYTVSLRTSSGSPRRGRAGGGRNIDEERRGGCGRSYGRGSCGRSSGRGGGGSSRSQERKRRRQSEPGEEGAAVVGRERRQWPELGEGGGGGWSYGRKGQGGGGGVRTSGEGRGRGLARREEDAATGDEPYTVSLRTSSGSRQGNSASRPSRGGRGGGGGSQGRERRQWPELGEGGGGGWSYGRKGQGGGGGAESSPVKSTSELVADDRVLRRELVTGGRVRCPRLNRRSRPPRRSSSPAPPPSPRRILHRPHPMPKLVGGAVSVTSQDPLPSMRPCPMHVEGRRQPCPPCWSSSPTAASSIPELVAGGRVRAAGVSLVCAAPMVACALASEGGGGGAIPLGQYPNRISSVSDLAEIEKRLFHNSSIVI